MLAGVISLRETAVLRAREKRGFQTDFVVFIYLESSEGRKMPSEHNADSPFTTINTVCGRSREIAKPKALRYLFS